MIKITNEDINNFRHIRSGRFGTVYQVDDNTAYKIYFPCIADDYSGKAITNPVLSLTSLHFHTLLKRSTKLKYSGGIQDLVYVDGEFGGVCIPYYDGPLLYEIMDRPLKLRIDLSRKMIRNAKELTGLNIFHTDYKLNNVILCKGNPQFVDLDDTRTHACFTPNPLFRYLSVNSLGETIQTFVSQFNHLGVPKNVYKELQREKGFSTGTYKKIEDYLDRKEQPKVIVFVDENSDLDSLREYVDKGFIFIYVLNSREEVEKGLDIINRFKQYGIPIYDFVIREGMDKYDNLEVIKEEYVMDQKELKKVNKKQEH